VVPVSAEAVTTASTATTSSLSTSLTKLPGQIRLNSTFRIAAPSCFKDEWGDYPYRCTEADLVFRVFRKHPDGWRRVYSYSTWVSTNSFSSLAGSDITRIYNWEYNGYKYYGGVVRNRRHRVRLTLVDNFSSTRNPSQTRYYYAKYRAVR
jgi:hypothetical protein